jgi:hypothetical protein
VVVGIGSDVGEGGAGLAVGVANGFSIPQATMVNSKTLKR